MLTFKPNIRVLVESHQAHSSHGWKWRKWCAALTVMFYVMLTSIVLRFHSLTEMSPDRNDQTKKSHTHSER